MSAHPDVGSLAEDETLQPAHAGLGHAEDVVGGGDAAGDEAGCRVYAQAKFARQRYGKGDLVCCVHREGFTDGVDHFTHAAPDAEFTVAGCVEETLSTLIQSGLRVALSFQFEGVQVAEAVEGEGGCRRALIPAVGGDLGIIQDISQECRAAREVNEAFAFVQRRKGWEVEVRAAVADLMHEATDRELESIRACADKGHGTGGTDSCLHPAALVVILRGVLAAHIVDADQGIQNGFAVDHLPWKCGSDGEGIGLERVLPRTSAIDAQSDGCGGRGAFGHDGID